MSSIINKVKGTTQSTNTTSQSEGTHGPHSSRMANAADPRIDSDRDHRAAHNLQGTGETYTGTGDYTTGAGAYTADTRPISGTDGPATKTDGPHKSNMMNKADPRVDSDRDYSKNMGANPHGTSGTGAYNVNETTRTGGLDGTNTGFLGGTSTTTHGTTPGTTTRTTAAHTGVPEGTYGPHGSRAANAVDPRIDSDLDNNRTFGAGAGHTTGTHSTATHGTTHGTATHGTATHGLGSSTGTHGTATHGTATHGTPSTTTHGLGSSTGAHGTGHAGAATTGPAPNTAGPHKSDLMNKLDPRVDSNLDGSKTIGGDKTFSRSDGSMHAHKDPTDAAQVPPSVLQKHIGEPLIAHGDHSHDRAKRNSISHQDQHRGL